MTNPQNCAGQPAGDSLEKLEAVLALCKSRKRAAGHVAPTISCMSDNLDALRRGQALGAATARLQAITAQAKADTAKTAAKAAASVLATAAKPAAPATGESVLDQFKALSGPAATAFYKEHGRAIRAELAARNEEQRRIEHEMKVARASARNLRELEKNNR
jgi:hypothetical protein